MLGPRSSSRRLSANDIQRVGENESDVRATRLWWLDSWRRREQRCFPSLGSRLENEGIAELLQAVIFISRGSLAAEYDEL